MASPISCNSATTGGFDNKRFESEGFGSSSASAVRSTQDVKRRFDGLPIHRACHYQSDHYLPAVALSKLRDALAPRGLGRIRRIMLCPKDSGNERDCLGMTPLHVLASSSSSRHDREPYELLIEHYPENLIAKDVSGYLPVTLALANDAPPEICRLLVESHRAQFPRIALDWVGMVETLGRSGGVPCLPGSVRNLLDTMMMQRSSSQSSSSPSEDYCRQQQRTTIIDWEEVVTEWAAQDTDRATDRCAPKFGHVAFKHIVKFSIAERLEMLPDDATTGGWRNEILRDIDTELRWYIHYRKESVRRVYSKLARYEHLGEMGEASSLLELALWKARIDDYCSESDEICIGAKVEDNSRQRCRIKSGADVIVPNVLSFLMQHA